MRANLREAMRLLKEAGFEIKRRASWSMPRRQAGQRRDSWSRIRPRSASSLFYKPSLERIGVTASIRTVDDAQYQNRLRSFDFDIITDRLGAVAVARQRAARILGSQAADRPGSQNIIGIKNPAVDALIDKVIFAKDRADLVAATKALDRVLLWNFYVVPQFTYGFSRYARWDRFSHAEPLPKYARSGFAVAVVVRCRQGRQDRQALLREYSAHGAALPPARARLSAPARWARRGFARRGRADAGAETHGISVFGDLKYPADFQHFDYVNLARAEGRIVFD